MSWCLFLFSTYKSWFPLHNALNAMQLCLWALYSHSRNSWLSTPNRSRLQCADHILPSRKKKNRHAVNKKFGNKMWPQSFWSVCCLDWPGWPLLSSNLYWKTKKYQGFYVMHTLASLKIEEGQYISWPEGQIWLIGTTGALVVRNRLRGNDSSVQPILRHKLHKLSHAHYVLYISSVSIVNSECGVNHVNTVSHVNSVNHVNCNL